MCSLPRLLLCLGDRALLYLRHEIPYGPAVSFCFCPCGVGVVAEGESCFAVSQYGRDVLDVCAVLKG